jgi:LacI family transcriptional regulator
MTSETDPELLAELIRRNVPIVLLDTGMAGPKSVNIRIDYAQGIQQAMEHLFSLNHRRIAFISGPLDLQSARVRHAAFVSGMEQRGIRLERALIEKGDHKIDGGATAMRNLLLLPQPPTAVITSNDLTAIGALAAIHDAGLRVPEDISLVGFDDIAFAHLTNPPLTTVLLSRTQLAVTAFRALDQLIQASEEHPSEYMIPAQLIIRGSTRAV